MTKAIAIFGEVLFDEFPDGSRILGGAPFNVAWHLQAFNAMPCFISRVGNDANGAAIREAMQAWGMATNTLQTDDRHPTGTVQVTFEENQPRYAILVNQAYDFIDATELPACDILYHGTLAVRHTVSAQSLKTLMARHRGIIFLDVNLRAPWWQQETLPYWLSKANWLKVNDEEFVQLQPHDDLKLAMREFLTRYDLQTLIVTRGEHGAVAVNRACECVEVKPTGKPFVVDTVDTVGAGDAFAAVLLLGLQRGWSLSMMMNRAQDFASALVTQRGATVHDLSFYQPFVRAWSL